MKLRFLLVPILSLLMSSCCKDCLLSRDEISWTRTREVNGDQKTEVHCGDKYLEITSKNGGTLKKFSLDDIEIFIPQKNDIILKDNRTGQSLAPIKQEKYGNNDKNMVCVESSLDNGLKLCKIYKIKLSTGDLIVSKKINNNLTDDKDILLVQTLSVRPGGYLIVPLSVISKYASRFITCDGSGETNLASNLKNRKILDEKLIFSTKGENVILSSDASDGWFGYVVDDKMLLVKYSLPNYKRGANSVIFTAKVSENKIDFYFGETTKVIKMGECMEVSERIILIHLDDTVRSIQDVENVINNIKIALVLVR